MAAIQSAGTKAAKAADWSCGCGQQYRVAVIDGCRTLWPRNSVAGFSTRGLGADAACVRCGQPLDVETAAGE